MKRTISFVIGIALAGLPLLVAAAPDFNGTWVRDNGKSDQMPNFAYWLTREPNSGGAAGFGGRGGRGGAPPVTMSVKQDAGSLEVTDNNGAIHKYGLDGKPFTRETDTDEAKQTITAKVQGDALDISTSQPWGGMPGNITLDIKEVWTLSPDGKSLTVTTTRTDAAQTKSYKQVWNRK